jgi:ferredoxin
MPIVRYVNWDKNVRAGPLTNLRAVARLAGISLHAGASKVLNCGGKGLCGTCRVKVEPAAALTPPNGRERLRGCTGPDRLACQAVIASDRFDITVVKMEGFSGKGRRPLVPEA